MELWDAYTADGVRTGVTLARGEPIPQGLYHMVCEVLLRHADGDFLLMQRAPAKATFGGYWEATAGGSALKGEDPLDCIRRELREETGLSAYEFTQLGINIYEDGKSIFYSFLATTDCPKDSVVYQEGETVDCRWVSPEEFGEFVKSDGMVPTQKRRLLPWLTEKGYLPQGSTVPVTVRELVDTGICPTCYDRSHDFALYGDPKDKMLYEHALFTCQLIDGPRALGHCCIISKAHYKDMTEIPDDLCAEVYLFAKRAMQALKQVYGCRSVYLCTMCDGPMNHFHVQLIPRFAQEQRGSRNFVKPRQEYIHDPEKINLLRELLRDCYESSGNEDN